MDMQHQTEDTYISISLLLDNVIDSKASPRYMQEMELSGIWRIKNPSERIKIMKKGNI